MSDDNALKLLPCECGSRPIVHYETIGKVWHFVDCVCGHDCGPSADTEPAAIAAWNRRTNADAFGIQTHAGMVYVAPHQYAQFVMTEGGWVVAER